MSNLESTSGADAIDVAIAKGIDFDGSPILTEPLALYNQVMAIEAGRQRSGVINTIRSPNKLKTVNNIDSKLCSKYIHKDPD
jgi:hypothetical protein